MGQTFLNLECIAGKGLVSEEESNLLQGIAVRFPSNQTDLLKALLAVTLLQGNTLPLEVSGTPISSEAITTDEVTPVSLTIPTGARYAVITPLNNSALFRIDGPDPDATHGHVLLQNQNAQIANLTAIRLIAFDNSAAVNLFISYFP